MGFRETTWAFEQKLNDPIAKLVLIGLADYYNAEKGYAWPSVERLAGVADCSVRTVQRKLKDLEDKGYIQRTHGHPFFDQRNSNVSSITIYQLVFDRVDRLFVEGGDSLSGGDKIGDGGDSSCRLGGDTRSHPKESERDIKKDVLKKSFDIWWAEYPRKVSKLSAFRVYEKIIQKEVATVEELLEGVKRYARKVDGSEVQYISHPDTWLNKGRWSDEEATVVENTNFGVAQKWMPKDKDDFRSKVNPAMKRWYEMHRPDVIAKARREGWL